MSDNYLQLVLCNDWYVFDNYITTNYKDYKVINCDSLISHKNEFHSKSLFSNPNEKKCYVVKHNEKELSSLTDILKDIIDGTYQNKSMVVYQLETIDKRSKIYKTCKNLIVEPSMDVTRLTNSILGNDELSAQSISRLYKENNQSISKCYYELLKVKSLSTTCHMSSDEALCTLLDERKSLEDIDTFDFINAIISKNKPVIKNCLRLIDTSEFDFGLATLLYNNLHNLCAIKEAGYSASQDNTGISPYIINLLQKETNKYTQKELNNLLKFMYTIDKRIKIGTLDSAYAYDFMLVGLFTVEKN